MLVHDTACVPQVAHRRREECRCRHRPRVSALLCSSKASPRASGTDWVLGPQVLPDILELAQRVEHSWLAWASGRGEALSPVALDPRFHLVDGGAGDTHIRIQNVVYASSLFRRCHLELAAGSKGLSVLHCVMYPWAAFDLPLFSLDIVAFGPRVTLAIVDVCPSRHGLDLPPAYEALAALAPLTAGLQLRGIPEWGTHIFSSHCVCVSPRDEGDVSAFSEYALALLDVHLSAAGAQLQVGPQSPEAVAATAAAHARFCEHQLRNDKTRRILAAALDESYADAYMKEVLFDAAPADAVPWQPTQGESNKGAAV